jgi:hypothetical protein
MAVTGRLHVPAALSLDTETPVRTQKEAGRLTENRFASSGNENRKSSVIYHCVKPPY